jgi:hypothetical protein
MKTDPFTALLVASGFIALGAVLALFLPETLQLAKKNDAAFNHLAPESDFEEEGISPAPAKSLMMDLKVSIGTLVEESRFIWANPGLCALIFTFILSTLTSNSISILFQLASQRFHWSLADVRSPRPISFLTPKLTVFLPQASFLIPFSSVTNFVILIVILPVIYSVLGSRFHLRPPIKDLLIARGSLIFLILGALAIALSPPPRIRYLHIRLRRRLCVRHTLAPHILCSRGSSLPSICCAGYHDDDWEYDYGSVAVQGFCVGVESWRALERDGILDCDCFVPGAWIAVVDH